MNALQVITKYRKFIVAGVGAAASIIVALGVENADWAQAIIALAVALGVYAVPNKSAAQ